MDSDDVSAQSRNSTASRGTALPEVWREFWNADARPHPLLRIEAGEYVRRLGSVIRLAPSLRVYDFGCGPAHVAELLAPHVASIHAWDDSASQRARARQRTASLASVRILDSPPGRDLKFDLILANSVVQYVSRDALGPLLSDWNHRLAPGGRVIVSDIPTPDCNPLGEAVDVLRLAHARHHLLPAIGDLLGQLPSYLRARSRRPLTRWTFEALATLAASHNLTATRLPDNLTHFRHRLSVVLERSPAPPAPGP